MQYLQTFGANVILVTEILEVITFASNVCRYCMQDLHKLLIDYIEVLRPSQQGWSGGAKVSCILCHRGVQLILAYSWARPAILVAGKGRGGMFLFLLFLHFHSCSSFFPLPLFHLF